jgi:hypothetical protein
MTDYHYRPIDRPRCFWCGGATVRGSLTCGQWICIRTQTRVSCQTFQHGHHIDTLARDEGGK